MTITRRQALTGLTLGAVAGAAPQPLLAQAASSARNTVLLNTSMCVLTPESVEGTFYFDPKLKRGDIAEGRPGVPLKLLLQIVNAGNCAPIPEARVDIWHSDATGQYSGYGRQPGSGNVSTRGQTFLRGTQFADLAGLARFTTIYPGWYLGAHPAYPLQGVPDREKRADRPDLFPRRVFGIHLQDRPAIQRPQAGPQHHQRQ